MNSCVFSQKCGRMTCSGACPQYVEMSYLLERNGIDSSNIVFSANLTDFKKYRDYLDKAEDKFQVFISKDTIFDSDMFAYCAICRNWKGNTLHCSVYHLNFSEYIDSTKASWSMRDLPEELEMQQIWLRTAKVLIISNIDYIVFNDFQVQTLLNLIHSRKSGNLTTILVSPKLNLLFSGSSDSRIFSRMQEILRQAVINK